MRTRELLFQVNKSYRLLASSLAGRGSCVHPRSIHKPACRTSGTTGCSSSHPATSLQSTQARAMAPHSTAFSPVRSFSGTTHTSQRNCPAAWREIIARSPGGSHTQRTGRKAVHSFRHLWSHAPSPVFLSGTEANGRLQPWH